ncbi:hypothetical protein EVB94_037 [Rhizobium phage RHph_TM40]|uniref:Uncharacterized protein n=1 Tax=Rhizobium phage RHph_Y65 TaxID=2509785 RepID=A0A7S5RD14_9CAUD|nr:hypothetical protein PQC17_gp037 [Rhizobium phage RHph_Y65]QIG71508.1 hypothetical protein EVB94_037 [Rhizobium phage RHph_TM40]QIG72233.1 hypothetical protein EVB96_037 [Rhizobium phage RHph_TM3_3_6]QIG72595.1 hypothetical protein EVB97_037 [Rhizobium phage RHph_Y65]
MNYNIDTTEAELREQLQQKNREIDLKSPDLPDFTISKNMKKDRDDLKKYLYFLISNQSDFVKTLYKYSDKTMEMTVSSDECGWRPKSHISRVVCNLNLKTLKVTYEAYETSFGILNSYANRPVEHKLIFKYKFIIPPSALMKLTERFENAACECMKKLEIDREIAKKKQDEKDRLLGLIDFEVEQQLNRKS